MLISYLYWDPSRAMFNYDLPLLGRPILWYGFLFALGFFIAYWVLLYLLHRYFFQYCAVFPADITNWTGLIEELQKKEKSRDLFKQLYSHSSKDTKRQINDYMQGKLITSSIQKGIVSAFNALLEDRNWEEPLSSRGEKKLVWFRKDGKRSDQLRLSHRLAFDEPFKPFLRSLQQRAKYVAETLTVYGIIGTLVGARLGDLFFYQDWRLILSDPFVFFRLWEGGLASHGGALGILCSIIFAERSLSRHYRFFSWVNLLDLIVIPAACGAVCIRIGNFFNQEILGKPTELPWAVIFGHPAGGGPIVPRHPVQIYEAFAYLSIFLILLFFWRRKPFSRRKGKLSGLFLILTFLTRFFLEYYKEEQSAYLNHSSLLTMGQILSIPMIGWGIWLFFFYRTEYVQTT